MKTIKEAARDYAIHEYWGVCEIVDCDGMIDKSEEDFKAGIEFAQRWIPVEEELPEVGEIVLVRTKINKVTTCEMYIPKDYLDNILGEKKWAASYNFIQAITHWRYIDLK